MDPPPYQTIAPKPPGLSGIPGKALLPAAPVPIRASESQPVARQKRLRVALLNPSEEKWKEVKPILDRLYDEEGLSLRVVTDIMWRLYHFKAPNMKYKTGGTSFEARGIRKNKAGPKSGRRTRPQRIPKPPPAAISQAIVRVGDFTFRPDMECLTQYPHQEKVLFSLDCYIYNLFDAGRKDGWTADLLSFIRRNGSSENTLASWQEISDQTYGASLQIGFGHAEQGEATLEKLFSKLREVAGQEDPSIFVKFWRICLGISGIDGRCGHRVNARARLLECLKEIFAKHDRNGHPLATMLSSLSEVSPPDFKDTLRIGFDKTLRTITRLVGDENAMILHMWSHFFRYWDSQYLVKETLLLKFQWVWDRVHEEEGITLHSEEAISVHYYYTYAAYYLCKPRILGEKMVVELFDRTEKFFCAVDEPRWSLTALAFAFSARITAVIHRDEGKEDLCRHVMNVAIEKLERGDRECATRAAMLSRVLAKWLKQWGYREESQTEYLRAARIDIGIGGWE